MLFALFNTLPPTGPAPEDPFHRSAGDALVVGFGDVVGHLARLSPAEAAIDAGLTALVAVAAWGLVRLSEWGLRRGVQHLARKGLADSRPRQGGERAAAASGGLLKVAIYGMAANLALQIWGFAPLGWILGRFGASALRIAGLIVLGVAGYKISGLLIDRSFHGLATRSRDARHAAQFETLRPIVRGLVSGCVAIFLGLMLLSELGVQIAPLLAGAGFVGVALGFGAQTLVKDFLTGLFLIIEDVVSVGDNVMIGGFSGRVETMSLLTICLRDFDGALHVFPYGEARVIHNRTKSFGYAVVEPRISYLADVEEAIGVMRETGEGLRADPKLGRSILEPLDVVGVEQFTDTGMVIKARIKTTPGEQWTVAREFYRRLKLALDSAQIELGYTNLPADRQWAGDHAREQAPTRATRPRPTSQ
jgi:small conductance mechanosensitive channel